MTKLSDMTKIELEKLLIKLKDDFNDIEEEKSFVLGQTGLHVSSKTVKKYDEELKNLSDKVEEIEKILLTWKTV